MRTLVLENQETKELRLLKPDAKGVYPNYRLPWKFKEIYKEPPDPNRIIIASTRFSSRCSKCGEMGVYQFT